jgi:long-chain fatty acid transport protein
MRFMVKVGNAEKIDKDGMTLSGGWIMPTRAGIAALAATLLLWAGAGSAWGQFGPMLSGAGPVNRSMAGASVAAPLDATGSMFWNPATSAVMEDTIEFGVELLSPETSLSSSLPANSIFPGVPPVALSGSSDGDNGTFVLPSAALVYTPDGSWLTYGLGLFPVAGFGVNYAASATNPILTPTPPTGLGLGALYSELQVCQIAPSISARISDRLSIGVGPTVNLVVARVNPMFFASPDDANGDGFFTYPDGGAHTHSAWGGGFQVGAYFAPNESWGFGAAVKSPQWIETLHFSTVDELGRPRNDTYDADLPLIASVGASYSGIESLLLAVDVRYLDFENADGFRQQGFAPATGEVTGLGFESIFAIALGGQVQLSDACTVRAGYSFNENPIPDEQSLFNVVSPTIIMHTVCLGASYDINNVLTISAGYLHGFENSIEGPIVLPDIPGNIVPGGAIPGSTVGSSTSANAFNLGASMRL